MGYVDRKSATYSGKKTNKKELELFWLGYNDSSNAHVIYKHIHIP